MTIYFIAGIMFDLTGSYTLAFVVGGGLCIASAIIMVHPFLYVRKHLHEVEQDVPEKEALASSMDIPGNIPQQYSSLFNVAKLAISMDVIPAIHKLSSLESLPDAKNAGSVDRLPLPATKRLMELKKFHSTASV